MGSAVSSMVRAALVRITQLWTAAPAPAKILLLGLDTCGKTTLLYRLHRGTKDTAPIQTIATLGFNAETIPFEDRIQFTAWDIGGSYPHLWRYYYEHTDAIVYLIDSTDRERFDEAIAALHRVFADNDALRLDLPLLVFANKQDCATCMTLDEIRAALVASSHVEVCTFDRPWLLLPLVATTADGADVGFAWLAARLQAASIDASDCEKV